MIEFHDMPFKYMTAAAGVGRRTASGIMIRRASGMPGAWAGLPLIHMHAPSRCHAFAGELRKQPVTGAAARGRAACAIRVGAAEPGPEPAEP